MQACLPDPPLHRSQEGRMGGVGGLSRSAEWLVPGAGVDGHRPHGPRCPLAHASPTPPAVCHMHDDARSARRRRRRLAVYPFDSIDHRLTDHFHDPDPSTTPPPLRRLDRSGSNQSIGTKPVPACARRPSSIDRGASALLLLLLLPINRSTGPPTAAQPQPWPTLHQQQHQAAGRPSRHGPRAGGATQRS